MDAKYITLRFKTTLHICSLQITKSRSHGTKHPKLHCGTTLQPAKVSEVPAKVNCERWQEGKNACSWLAIFAHHAKKTAALQLGTKSW